MVEHANAFVCLKIEMRQHADGREDIFFRTQRGRSDTGLCATVQSVTHLLYYSDATLNSSSFLPSTLTVQFQHVYKLYTFIDVGFAMLRRCYGLESSADTDVVAHNRSCCVTRDASFTSVRPARHALPHQCLVHSKKTKPA